LLYSKSAIKKDPIVIPFKKAWKNKWFVVGTCKLWEYVAYFIFFILNEDIIYAKFENVLKKFYLIRILFYQLTNLLFAFVLLGLRGHQLAVGFVLKQAVHKVVAGIVPYT